VSAPEGKSGRVRVMFGALAPSYDLMNRVMTFGRYQYWRRFVVRRAALPPAARVLDLASGTGDIAFEIKRRHPDAAVTAADFAVNMLEVGKRRPGGAAIEWRACDAADLPFPDACFEAVTFGYLLRNVEDVARVLAEVRRVLVPGGRVVCLDTSPPSGPLRPFLCAYLKYVLPFLGRLVARNPEAYTYLSASTLGFREPQRLAADFSDAGFVDVCYRRFMFGTIAVHWADKPDATRSE